jgi:hypothetical protein
MRDQFYERSAVQDFAGGWRLSAMALAQPWFSANYPRFWCCSHEDGKYHRSAKEAMACPQYPEFLRQVG